MDVRTALLQLRSELSMTQAELAGGLGISAITLCRWEKGNHKPSRTMSLAVLSFASSRRASAFCQNALKEALLPSPRKPRIDDLRYARLEQVNRLVNDSSNAVIVSDFASHDILYLNRQTAAMTGKPLEQAAGQKCYQYLFGKDHPCEFCNICGFSEDAYITGHYVSPRTGRYFVSRGKIIRWNDRKAHIEYISDMTDFHQTEQELSHHRELLAVACENAQMWVFSLTIQDGLLHLDQTIRQAMNLPMEEPIALSAVIASDDLLGQYADQFAKALSDLRSGVREVAIVVQIHMLCTRAHWLRFRARCIERDDVPQLAVCSAQIIDEEMALQQRIRFEHEQIIGLRRDLMGYVISDLTANVVVEAHGRMDQGFQTAPGSVYDAAITEAQGRIEPPADQAQFLQTHQRALLLQRFERGELEQSFEYQLLQPEGKRIWVHTDMKLVLQPDPGHVFLYEYCYAVHTRRIVAELLRMFMRNGYDTLGAVSLADDQVARLPLSSDGELTDQALLFSSYTEETRAYCLRMVVPEEQAGFLRAMALDRVCRELADKNTYRVAYHELTAGGSPRTMVSEYTLYDRKHQFCLLSVWDEAVLRQSINHVADATTEAEK